MVYLSFGAFRVPIGQRQNKQANQRKNCRIEIEELILFIE
jgi:hypothetical protein